MKVLVIGSGGREHALAWAVARSTEVETVFVAPGNAGTEREAGKLRNVPLDQGDFAALARFAAQQSVALTIVGPEVPLAAGIRDFFDGRGQPCFGPSRRAAQLESSKSFAKDFMNRHGIPTARFATFTDAGAAEAHIRARGAPVVVKADGLAAGKGVVVCQSVDQAVQAACGMLDGGRFGDAGRQVVVEDFLDGEEASFTCVVDGANALPLASSQDHKPRDDGDRGPNTGGMGAYSPAPVVTAAVHERIMAEIVMPTMRGMAAEGAPLQGFLYVGLMIKADGSPRVVEFNCRFGDPEAQPVLTRLRSDFAQLCLAALQGGVGDLELDWDRRAALGVVLAAGGYPLDYGKGDVITGLDADLPDTKVFHAGTKRSGDHTVTDGGRVLCVVGLGEDIVAAQRLAYQRAARIHWRDVQYRRDIGFRATQRAFG